MKGALLTTAAITVAATLSFNASGGVEGLHKFWIDKTFQNTSKIKNYSARVRQSGSDQPDAIITEVKFQQPDHFFMQVSSPQMLSGLSVSYQQGSLIYFNPSLNHAVKLEGLATAKASGALQRIEDMYWFNHEHYERTFVPSVEVAQRVSVGLDLKAKEPEHEIQTSNLFVDYDYSIVMKGDFYYRNGSSASLTHEAIHFNQEDFFLPENIVPQEAHIQSWNFRTAAVSRQKAEEKLTKKVIWPEKVNERWKLGQANYFLMQKGGEGVASYAHNDNYFLVSMAEETEREAWGLGMPLNFSTTVNAKIMQSPSINSIGFRLDGVNYHLISNIHAEDLIAVARKMVDRSG